MQAWHAQNNDLQETACTAYLSGEAGSLLRGLLQREPGKRLGTGICGSESVMGHAFFRNLDWHALLARRLPSPFRPPVNHADSVENFDKIWTDLAPEDSPCGTPPRRGAAMDQGLFEVWIVSFSLPDL